MWPLELIASELIEPGSPFVNCQKYWGRVLATTVTVKEQPTEPAIFVAVQLTVVVPTGNALPEAGLLTTVGAGMPVAATVKFTTAEV